MEYKERVFIAVGFIGFLIAVGTVAYMSLEGWAWYDALYFSTTSLTTAAYGDLAPSTVASKLFTVVYLLVGVGAALYTMTIVAQHYFENHLPKIRDRWRKDKEMMRRK